MVKLFVDVLHYLIQGPVERVSTPICTAAGKPICTAAGKPISGAPRNYWYNPILPGLHR